MTKVRICGALLALIVASGCDFLDGGSGGGGDGSGEGPDAGGPAECAEPWCAESLGPTTLNVGESILVEVSGVAVGEEGDVRLWLADEPWPVRGGTTRGEGDEFVVIVEQPLAVLDGGVVEVRFGTDDEAMSNALEFEVVLPEPMMTQAEAGELLAAGIESLALDMQALIDSDTPGWSEFVAELGDTEREQIADLVTDVTALGAYVEENYAELSAEEDRIAQAWFASAGIFEAFAAGVESKNLDWSDRSFSFLGEAESHPVHSVLMRLDALEFALAGTMLGIDVFNVLVIVGVVTAPLVTVGFGVNVAIASIRWALNTLIPTDLMALEIQTQRTTFDGEPAKMVVWGTFETQNPVMISLTDFVADVISATIPGPRVGEVYNLITNFILEIATHLPGRLLFGWIETESPLHTARVLVNPDYYEDGVGGVLGYLQGGGRSPRSSARPSIGRSASPSSWSSSIPEKRIRISSSTARRTRSRSPARSPTARPSTTTVRSSSTFAVSGSLRSRPSRFRTPASSKRVPM